MPVTKEQLAEGWVSVTQVLDAFIPKELLAWHLRTGAKEAKRLSTMAKKIGTRVDELIQEEIKTGNYKLTAKDSIEVKNCMEAWKQFKSDYSPHIRYTQIEVSKETDKLIGHIDLVMDGRVIDIKCASSIKPNHWLQVAAYSDMFDEEVAGVGILRLDKNLGTYQFVTESGSKWQECVEVFYGMLKAYRYYNAPKGQEE